MVKKIFKILIQLLGLPCMFSKSILSSHVHAFYEYYENLTSDVLAECWEHVKDKIEAHSGTAFVPAKLVFGGTRAKGGFKSLFGVGFAITLDEKEICKDIFERSNEVGQWRKKFVKTFLSVLRDLD